MSCILTRSELLPSLQKHWEQLTVIYHFHLWCKVKKAEFPLVGFGDEQTSISHTSHPSEPAWLTYNKLQKGWDIMRLIFMYAGQNEPLSIQITPHLLLKVGFVIVEPHIILAKHWIGVRASIIRSQGKCKVNKKRWDFITDCQQSYLKCLNHFCLLL